MGFSRNLTNSIQYFLRSECYNKREGVLFNRVTSIIYEVDSNVKGFWSLKEPVRVYRNGDLVDENEYNVSYITGRIVFNSDQVAEDIITADFGLNWCTVLDSFPDTPFEQCVITVEQGMSNSSPLELGGNSRWIYTQFFLNVYPESTARRDDYSQFVRDLLDTRDIPLLDYGDGFPLNTNGTINQNYVEKRIGTISFEAISVTPNPTGSGDETEKNRALIRTIAVSERY